MSQAKDNTGRQQQTANDVVSVSDHSSRHPNGPTAEDWDSVKDVIRQLYVYDQYSLKQVKEHMESNYNFHATERMFKTRLGPWGLNKNSKNNDWAAIAKLHKVRKESGKSATEFRVHGRKRTLAQLRKHIKSKSMTDQQFLSAALDVEIPPHIRCYTPEPEDAADAAPRASHRILQSAAHTTVFEVPPLSSPTTLTSSLRISSASLPTPQSDHNEPLPSVQAISLRSRQNKARLETPPEWTAGPQPTLLDDSIVIRSPSWPGCLASKTLVAPCQHIQNQLNQMAKQALAPSVTQQSRFEDLESWVFLTNPLSEAENGPLLNCPQCHQSVSSHLGNLDDYVHIERSSYAAISSTSQPDPILTSEHRAAALKWVVRCFSACIYLTYGTSTFAQQSLADAEGEVENMLATNNPLTLTSLNLILSILHVHDQGQTVESIVGSALKVASKVLGCEDPITVTIAWMTAAAGQKLPQPGLDAAALRQIYSDFTEKLGNDHPHSITALYNLSWNLIIDGAWEEAENNLRQLHQTSCNVLGPSHMQSITALTSLSRVLSNQNKNDAAVETMQEAIERSENTLGPSHPYRLESKRRLALMYEKVNDKSRMKSLYWDVVRGRAKMLGRTHPYTIGAKVDLIQLLQDLGEWDDHGQAKTTIDALFEQQDDFKARHEAF